MTFPTEINFCHLKSPGKLSYLDSKNPPPRACDQTVKKIHKTMNQEKGFTLIELFAVIAIIALLAGLAFPVIKKTMDQSNRSKSMVNLRTLHAGMATQAAETGFWPTLSLENPDNPSLQGNNSWYETLLRQGYIPVKRIRRDDYNILYSDALISPANKANQGYRYPWTREPYPWTSSYAIPRFWGEKNVVARVPFLGGINNSQAIMLVECLNKYSGIYPAAPENHADWTKPSCALPGKDDGKGALALLANGSVISVTPKSHPDLPSRKYWDPRYIAP